MNVLMLSIDDGSLLVAQQGGRQQGDTIKRHIQYGRAVGCLDIIVTSKPGFNVEKLSEHVTVFPTNAKKSWGHYFATLRYARELFERKKYSLIVAQDITSPAAWWLSYKYKIPYLVTTHGTDWGNPDLQRGLGRDIVLLLMKLAMRRSYGLRVVSSAVKDFYLNQGFKQPIEVIPTASDYTIFSKQSWGEVNEVREKFNSDYLILTVGRLERVKNHPMLFKVLKLIQDSGLNIKLLIVGSGSLEKELKQQVKNFNLENNIVFLGSLAYEDMVPYVQACDVFVLSSNSESLGKVILEAGMSGKPVVTTDTLGAKGIITNSKNGFLVEKNDSKVMSEKVIKLLKDKSLRDQMGQMGKKNVLQNYDAKENIKKFVEFWYKVKIS